MNKTIRRASVFCLLLVLALLVRVTWVQAYQGQALADDEHNKRNVIERYAGPLGNIIVGGKAVTGSKKVDQGNYMYMRTYTDGPLYAPVTGYSSQVYGKNQLEKLYEKVLDGSDTRLKNPLDVLTGKRAEPGNVITTIDPAVQKAGYEALRGKTGAAVALDPATGAVLGIVVSPSYDPGRIAGSTKAYEKAWKELSAEEGRSMLNLALRQPVAPGSTFKLVTMAAALEKGLYGSIDEPTDSPDPYTLPGTRTVLKNESASAPCENASLRTALRYSCNNVFANLAHRLGQDTMRETAEKFGFNDPEQDIPVRATTSLYPKAKMSPDQVAQTGIGQFDVTATPLQMAMVSAAVENGGKLVDPFMVSEVTDADGNSLESHKDRGSKQIMSGETAEKLRDAMRTVVTEGGGRTAQVDGAEVGGKTGTAQRGVNNSKSPYAWFTSYGKKDGRWPSRSSSRTPTPTAPRSRAAASRPPWRRR
jgi:peptidoglycan glycosyltransferase